MLPGIDVSLSLLFASVVKEKLFSRQRKFGVGSSFFAALVGLVELTVVAFLVPDLQENHGMDVETVETRFTPLDSGSSSGTI